MMAFSSCSMESTFQQYVKFTSRDQILEDPPQKSRFLKKNEEKEKAKEELASVCQPVWQDTDDWQDQDDWQDKDDWKDQDDWWQDKDGWSWLSTDFVDTNSERSILKISQLT